MTTHDRDKVITAAKEAGSSVVGGDDGTDTQCWTGDIAFDEEGLDLFYAIAFEDGAASRDAEVAELKRQLNEPVLLSDWQKLTKERDQLREQVTLYEQALIESWPEGERGNAFDFWNAARKLAATEPK